MKNTLNIDAIAGRLLLLPTEIQFRVWCGVNDVPVSRVCQKAEVHFTTFYRWIHGNAETNRPQSVPPDVADVLEAVTGIFGWRRSSRRAPADTAERLLDAFGEYAKLAAPAVAEMAEELAERVAG